MALLGREAPPRVLTMDARKRLTAAMPGLKERAKTIVELNAAADFLYTDGPRALDAAAEKLLTADARTMIRELLPMLEAVEWNASALEALAKGFAISHLMKLGQVAQPLRAALTGKASSPPLFEMMVVLGRAESLTRLRAYAA